MFHKGGSLNDLAPIAADQAMFMPQNDQSDVPDPSEGVDMGYSTEDFPTHEQDSLPEPGTSTFPDARHASAVMPEQPDQSGHEFPRMPDKAVEQHSSSSTYVPRVMPNPFGLDELVEVLPTSV